MDKETLSNYGWIVICVLVLAVMIALATPFGQFISDAIWGTTKGLFNTNQKALGATGLIDTTEYIELQSEEQVYALARILSNEKTKTDFYGSTYNLDDDLNMFEYPEDITDASAKIEYLASASYKLISDISLTFKRANDTSFFIGIGSSGHPFKGTFDGNGKTITLQANGKIGINGSMNLNIGLFGDAQNAIIKNTNINVVSDILVQRTTSRLKLGTLLGNGNNCEITNCNTTISNSKVGVDYADGETYTFEAHIGGLVGESKLTTIKNCTVTLTDGTVYAKGYNIMYEEKPSYNPAYAHFSVGGILGFSQPGSNNTENIGRIGNQLLNCKVVSNNTTQRDVIYASTEISNEVVAGGLVGCTFNNFVAKNCSVVISKGNIVAQKTGETDDAEYGTNAGGIIGRLEHTGELYGCTVNGDYLNIISRSPENESNAGGIVGIDLGPQHRDIITLNNCHFDGNGTSTIVLDITADATKDKVVSLGGVAGCANYKVNNCSAKNVTLVNRSENIDRNYTGGICGMFNRNKDVWETSPHFTASVSELTNCTSNNIIFDTADDVIVGEDIGRHWYN